MLPTPDSNEPLLPQQEEKLRELTTQSWNLELVISGAALFAVLQLPDLLDEAFDYFRYNLMSQTAGMQGLFPAMAYSMMKATCYVLFLAFLTNFVMRAFWVGLVGLLAVYPTGIHYDRIPFSTKYAQERMATELGPLDAYIMRLDRRCNIVFAVAFLFVFILIFVALSYLLTLLVYSVIHPIIPDQYWEGIKQTAYGLIICYFIASTILSLPKVRAHPRGASIHYRLTSLNKLLFWGFHRPYGFILNTFYSHLPYQKIIRTMGGMTIAFFVLIILEFYIDFSRLEQRKVNLRQRHLYTARLDSLYINPSAYDNQRAEGQYVDRASIQADVIRDPYIQLYIAYPKTLDTLLTRLSTEPVWSDTPFGRKRRKVFFTKSAEGIGKHSVFQCCACSFHIVYSEFKE
ncbi:hypothetical protein [Spirosoma radiotolerans]|uniref:hypothetical protein n=1 Tax=Spirosoma radiotolerans TaxID=1379870 RepID=UPI000AAB5240|nr:hypothetical protein [Spirosoma radiotolerans]